MTKARLISHERVSPMDALVLCQIDQNTWPKRNFAYVIVVDNLAKYL